MAFERRRFEFGFLDPARILASFALSHTYTDVLCMLCIDTYTYTDTDTDTCTYTYTYTYIYTYTYT